MNSSFAPTGAIAGSVLPIRRAEELIATLPGVLSVRIVPSEAGAIDEVHVLTTDVIAPKQTVRNIESALIAQLGLRVNHRKISIATTLDPNRANDAPPQKPVMTVFGPPSSTPVLEAASSTTIPFSGPQSMAGSPIGPQASVPSGAGASSYSGKGPARLPTVPQTVGERRLLVFEDVELRRSRERGLTCRVTLSQGTRKFVGESKGLASEKARIDLAARATVLAIEDVLLSQTSRARALTLEGTQTVAVFDREFVFVTVAARDGRDSVRLSGSCEVHESAETSSVLAVLNATNRWIQLER